MKKSISIYRYNKSLAYTLKYRIKGFLYGADLRKLFKLYMADDFMLTHKNPRQKGKISFKRYFQEFKPGDYVAVSMELSVPFPYPKKLQGRTGKVIEKRKSAYYLEINDLNKPKYYNIKPIHLKKIELKK